MRRRKILPRQPLLRLGLVACLCATAVATPGLADELTVGRQSELRNLVVQDCGSCHGMTLRGGLGSPLQPGDLDGIEAATIALIVLDGIPETPMPPWRGLLSDEDALWIAQALKSGDIK